MRGVLYSSVGAAMLFLLIGMTQFTAETALGIYSEWQTISRDDKVFNMREIIREAVAQQVAYEVLSTLLAHDYRLSGRLRCAYPSKSILDAFSTATNGRLATLSGRYIGVPVEDANNMLSLTEATVEYIYNRLIRDVAVVFVGVKDFTAVWPHMSPIAYTRGFSYIIGENINDIWLVGFIDTIPPYGFFVTPHVTDEKGAAYLESFASSGEVKADLYRLRPTVLSDLMEHVGIVAYWRKTGYVLFDNFSF